MRRAITLLLILTLCFSLAGCKPVRSIDDLVVIYNYTNNDMNIRASYVLTLREDYMRYGYTDEEIARHLIQYCGEKNAENNLPPITDYTITCLKRDEETVIFTYDHLESERFSLYDSNGNAVEMDL